MLELCVIFGGQSPEHEISRKSVTSVLNNLNKDADVMSAFFIR